MKIKWVENKADNVRANFCSKAFKVNNSSKTFVSCAIMSYKCFSNCVRKFAQYSNSTCVEIIEDDNSIDNIGVINMEQYGGGYKFRIEHNVIEGKKREYTYFEESEIFS